MFVQRKHPITGSVEWVAVNDVAAVVQDDERVMKGLMATSHYLDMLNDDYRNQCYHRALQKIVKPGDRVLDIGTGSGLLALLAAQCLSPLPTEPSSRGVVACEVFPPMASLAKQIIKLNAMEHLIQVVAARSDELPEDISQARAASSKVERFDVVVTEIFDSELIGEGLLNTMHHAMKHLTADCPSVIPARATVYCQVVESDIMQQWQDGFLEAGRMASVKECDLSSLYPAHLKPLSDVVPMFEFDLANPPDCHRTTNTQMPICEGGSAHAVVLWWVLELDPGGTIQLSTQPTWIQPEFDQQKWRQHWKQCWVPLPSIEVHNHSVITLRCEHDDLNITVGMESADGRQGGRSTADRLYPSSVPSRRIWELRDTERKGRIRAAVSKALRKLLQCVPVEETLHLILLGEQSFLAEMVAEEMPTDRSALVMLAQETLAGLKEVSAQVFFLETENMKFHCVHLADVLNGSDVIQQLEVVHGVISEPYFFSKEGQEPWMHYYMMKHCIEQLHTCELLSQHCLIYPSGCRIVCCGVSLPEMCRTRKPLDQVEGWDLSLLNGPLGAVGAQMDPLPCFSASVWQCGKGFHRLTDATMVLEDSVDDLKKLFAGSYEITMPIIQSGRCDAVALWVEHPSLTSKENPSHNGCGPVDMPHFSVHGICLLPEAVVCHTASNLESTTEKIKIRLTADPDTLKFCAEAVPTC